MISQSKYSIKENDLLLLLLFIESIGNNDCAIMQRLYVVICFSDNMDSSLNISVDEFTSKKATNKLIQQTKVSVSSLGLILSFV